MGLCFTRNKEVRLKISRENIAPQKEPRMTPINLQEFLFSVAKLLSKVAVAANGSST